MKNFVKLLLLCTIICLGYIFGVNVNSVEAHTYTQDSSTAQTPPPSQYDLRDNIYIEVENQHNLGVCYAFASLTSLETYLALNYNEYYDFSEMHFATSLCLKDDYYSSIEKALNDGGNFNTFVLYTQKDNSLVLDQVMPIDKYRTLLPYQREQELENDYNNINNNYYPLAKVNDTKSFDAVWGNKAKYTPTELNNFRTEIKNHIMQYGSISASIHSNAGFSNSTQYYRVVDDSIATSQEVVRKNVNHMISVVGWDDNYDANGQWPNKGAYLCLNSWGTSFGQDGYFYVSYDDYFIESSMHGVVDATLCTSNNKISTIKSYQNKTRIYSHIYREPPTSYTANIINVSQYLGQTIYSIDNFVMGSNYAVYYKFFNSYNDAISGINSTTTKINISSHQPYSLYTKLNLAYGLNISNNYLLLVTKVDETYEVNSLGGSSLNNLNLVPTYNQQKGLTKFNLTDDLWDPSVPNGPADLTIPIILHLNTDIVEVLPIESSSQSIIHDKYIQNNAIYINKTLTIKLNNASLNQNIINNIKIVKIDGYVDVTSNFKIALHSGNINISLTKANNLNFNQGKNNYLISIPCSDTTIYRLIQVHDVGQSYNISYNLDGGQADNPTTYTSKHSALYLNSPTKTGYEFIGWYTDSSLTTAFDPNNLPYADLTLYAKYKVQAPIIVSKSSDIDMIYNGKDISLSVVATHPLTSDNYKIKYQWYYAKTASSAFEPISNAVSSNLIISNISNSGYYACTVSLVDASNNVLSQIDYNNTITHIKVSIAKASLTIEINNIISNIELSNEEITSRYSCKIDCEYLPENITEYQDILDYLQLNFVLSDTANPNVKTISATIGNFDFYDVYIKSGQYRVVIDQLNSNNISTTSDKGFTKDCVFTVAQYGISDEVYHLLQEKHLNFVDSYDLSYSYLDSSATIYIPLDSKSLLTNIAVYMYKDNQLVRLDSTKSSQGISFNTSEPDAKYIIVQEKPNKLSNIDFLILIIVVVILGTFTAYIVITKHNH